MKERARQQGVTLPEEPGPWARDGGWGRALEGGAADAIRGK